MYLHFMQYNNLSNLTLVKFCFTFTKSKLEKPICFWLVHFFGFLMNTFYDIFLTYDIFLIIKKYKQVFITKN